MSLQQLKEKIAHLTDSKQTEILIPIDQLSVLIASYERIQNLLGGAFNSTPTGFIDNVVNLRGDVCSQFNRFMNSDMNLQGDYSESDLDFRSLGFDSLDIIELSISMEDSFDVRIFDTDLIDVKTPKEFIDLICGKLINGIR